MANRNAYEPLSIRYITVARLRQGPPTSSESGEPISTKEVLLRSYAARCHQRAAPPPPGGTGGLLPNVMTLDHAHYWLIQSKRRVAILAGLDQPLTASQISRRTGITLDSCLALLWGMVVYGILFHLNPSTRYSRLYWLTRLGMACQRRLRQKLGQRQISYRFPDIRWDLYSSVCYSHRSAVVKAMRGPMQAAEIKRKAHFHNPSLRMSANNVRDVMRYLLTTGIVRQVTIRRKRHPRYELTDLGRTFQDLLFGAQTFTVQREVAKQ